ncbi:MAG: hypothetical protein QF685_12645, partial [Verrucomicrobiota bacterium]|nr:hypothetical protein [Verrucomicrobiota bacterium]
MKSQTQKNSTLTATILLIGVGILSPLNDLVAQETTRRVLRSTRISEPSPESAPMSPATTGGAESLGADPSRSESGRPEPLEGKETAYASPSFSGDPEQIESEMPELPLMNDPFGGAGDPEQIESEMPELPLMNDPFGGAGDPEQIESEMPELPLMNDPFGGAG